MKQETLIDRMGKYREIEAKIKLNNLEIEKRQIFINKINEKYDVKITPTYSEGGKAGNTSSQQEQMLIKKETEIKKEEDAINALKNENQEYKIQLEEIDIRLNILPEEDRKIIILKYIDKKKVEEIEKYLGISYMNIYRSYTKSLKKMAKL